MVTTQTQSPESLDPMDSAMDAEWTPRTLTFFGNLSVDTYYCVLAKGVGKVLFDPNQHNKDQRCTAITFILDVPSSMGRSNQPIQREMIAESKEWSQIVKPSLVALNANLRSIHNKWVRVEIVPAGQKYTNKNGEEKLRTTFKFVALYGSQEECQAACEAFFAALNSGGNTQAPPAQTPVPATSADDPQKKTALAFLPALWKQSNGDVMRLSELIAGNPLTSKFFTISSPEVITIIGA